MSESTREDILECMTRMLDLSPEMRFGQLVTWVSSMGARRMGTRRQTSMTTSSWRPVTVIWPTWNEYRSAVAT